VPGNKGRRNIRYGQVGNADLAVLTIWEKDFSRASLIANDDVGSSAATASALTPCEEYAFELARNDRDFFVFESAANQPHEFRISPGTSKEFAVVIRDQNQDVVSRTTVRKNLYRWLTQDVVANKLRRFAFYASFCKNLRQPAKLP
jgi:hypothetical protein